MHNKELALQREKNFKKYSTERIYVSPHIRYRLYLTSMIKNINLILLILILSVIAYMFKIKSEVQDLNFEYKQLSKQYSEEKKQLSILKAELTYLKSPKRLQTLASMYLNLDNIKPSQLVNNKNEVVTISKNNFISASSKLKGKKWRYKKSSSSVHNASISSKK